MSNLLFGALALVGIVIIAMALSANSTGAKIVQWGLAIAILGVLLRNTEGMQTALGKLTDLAIGTTGKQTDSGRD